MTSNPFRQTFRLWVIGTLIVTSSSADPGKDASKDFKMHQTAAAHVAPLHSTTRSDPRADAVRALVVTGGHHYDTSFYTLFEGYEDLVWTHETSNHSAFRVDIRPTYDVVVLYDLSREIGKGEQANLRAFLESGDKGLVVLHHAIADYNSWRWWYQEVVGGKYLLEPDGELPASTFKHDEELFVEVVRSHPVTEGISAFHLTDETYRGMWISPDVTILLETDNPTSDGPLAWVSPYEKARVVCIQLGHGRKAHLNPGYRKLVINAILWAAGRASGRRTP